MKCGELTEIHKIVTKTAMQLNSYKQQCLPNNFYLCMFAKLALNLEA